MTRLSSFALLLLVTLVGCSDAKFVPVSGIVKIDGVPYSKAVVTFQPISVANDPNPGRGSSSYTDENGRYTLECGTIKGALIGKHRVRIQTAGGNVRGQDPTTEVAADGAPAQGRDPIPPKWNADSDKEFEVPPGGTDKADFDIVTK
jgi:hypothetical protein